MNNSEKECITITKVILPAIRASIAQAMNEEYDWTQEKIAAELGVVQVAVSKYINKKYSEEVASMNNYVNDRGVGKKIAKEIVQGKSKNSINTEIDEICAEIMINKNGAMNGRRVRSV